MSETVQLDQWPASARRRTGIFYREKPSLFRDFKQYGHVRVYMVLKKPNFWLKFKSFAYAHAHTDWFHVHTVEVLCIKSYRKMSHEPFQLGWLIFGFILS